VHHKSILLNVQRDATICNLYFILLQDHSTCFGFCPHQSSGVYKTVVTATGTSHMIMQLPHSNVTKLATSESRSCTTICLVPVAVATVLCTPDDGCRRHPKHVEWYCSKIKYRIHIVASRWTFVNIDREISDDIWCRSISNFLFKFYRNLACRNMETDTIFPPCVHFVSFSKIKQNIKKTAKQMIVYKSQHTSQRHCDNYIILYIVHWPTNVLFIKLGKV
jgi:hypothetical protein